MYPRLLDLLACPHCRSGLECTAASVAADGEILDGKLICGSGHSFRIVNGIPRFAEENNYAATFGLQWNVFSGEQLDSVNGTRLSERRLFDETGWTAEWMRGKWILDAGCGAGRFVEIAARSGAEVVGFDLSNAVDAARRNLHRANIHLVQASMFEPPFRPGGFDACYCIGVLQHTPDPPGALRRLPPLIRPGGRIAVTAYERRRWTMLHGKYWARRLTRWLPERLLLRWVKVLVALLFPLTEGLYRLPYAGKVFRFAIPVANYVENKELSLGQRYRLAVLDTFDMLAPRYDLPMTEEQIRASLAEAGVANIRRLGNAGANLVGEIARGEMFRAAR